MTKPSSALPAVALSAVTPIYNGVAAGGRARREAVGLLMEAIPPVS